MIGNKELQSGYNIQEQVFSSSWLARAAWNADSGEIDVQFRDGFVYNGTLSKNDWFGLISAPSPGRAWHKLMREGKV